MPGGGIAINLPTRREDRDPDISREGRRSLSYPHQVAAARTSGQPPDPIVQLVESHDGGRRAERVDQLDAALDPVSATPRPGSVPLSLR
jgi:hypothetical protein